MNYLKFSLDHKIRGTVIEAVLEGVESDVFLVDEPNLSSFEDGRNFRYVGGHYKTSPVRLTIPAAGLWTLIVIPGLGGTVSASVRVVGT